MKLKNVYQYFLLAWVLISSSFFAHAQGCSGTDLQTYFEQAYEELPPEVITLLGPYGVEEPSEFDVSSLPSFITNALTQACNANDPCVTGIGTCQSNQGNQVIASNLLDQSALYNGAGVLQSLISSGDYGLPSQQTEVYCGGTALSQIWAMPPQERALALEGCRSSLRQLTPEQRQAALLALFQSGGNIISNSGGGAVQNNGPPAVE